MSLEQHVPSRQLCEEWKRRGGRQDTPFSWFNSEDGVWVLVLTQEYWGHDLVAAPLVSEMMEWGRVNIDWLDFIEILIDWWRFNKHVEDFLPNALMQMLLERKEK